MKVLFYYRGRESLGVESLMAYLKQRGHSVALLFDPGFEDNFFFKFPFGRRLSNPQRLIRMALDFAPDLLAFSFTTNMYPFVQPWIRRLRETTGASVVVGGPHPTAVPAYMLRNPDIDYVCVGEGEEALAELTEYVESGRDPSSVANIGTRQAKEAVVNPPRPLTQRLEELPAPYKEPFFRAGAFGKMLLFATGRGCHYRCTFCQHSSTKRLYKGLGPYVRRLPPDAVVEQLSRYRTQFPIDRVWFADDIFAINTSWLEEFSETYSRRIHLPFYCLVHPDHLDQDTIELLRRCGCQHIYMGVDSGDPALRKTVLGRNLTDETILRAAKRVRAAGIELEVTGIFGFPGEGPDQMQSTMRFVRSLHPTDAFGFIFYPFPGTDLFRSAKDQGLLDRQAVLEGRGCYLRASPLHHPYRDECYCRSKLLPLYAKAPGWSLSFLDRIIRKRWKRVAGFLFLITLPYTLRWESMGRLREYMRMLRASLTSMRG